MQYTLRNMHRCKPFKCAVYSNQDEKNIVQKLGLFNVLWCIVHCAMNIEHCCMCSRHMSHRQFAIIRLGDYDFDFGKSGGS